MTSKKFFEKKSAEKAAIKAITDFIENDEDPDFEIVEHDDSVAVSKVVDSLVHIVMEAKERQAAILIPNYTTASPNSLLIQTALDFVDFQGPVINISLEDQVAWDTETAMQTYSVHHSNHRRGILLARTSHSFQITGNDSMSLSIVAARLISVITLDPDSKTKSAKAKSIQPNKRATAVFAGGGQAVLKHISESVRVGAHVVVLQGSGRLCDYLPRVWVKRYSAHFDAFEAGRQFCMECGFPLKESADDGRRVRDIMLRGHVKIHALANGPHALQRVLRSVWQLDEALVQAVKRHCEYATVAKRMLSREFKLLMLKVAALHSPTRLAHP